MSLFEKVKSKYIRILPFQFINENILYKLVNYSKKAQLLFDLKLSDFKQIFFNNLDLNAVDYLSKFNSDSYYPSDQQITSLNDSLEEDIQKYNSNFEVFQNYAINYITNYIKKEKINYEKKISIDDLFIDIFSPFIDTFSQNKLYQKIFTIPVVISFIKEHNLMELYSNFFEKLNKSQLIYDAFYFIFNDIKELNEIKNFGINFQAIKRLAFKIKSKVLKNFEENDLFDIFKLNKIENNLTTLVIDSKLNIKSDIFENINNFKYLSFLSLKNINFDKQFTIKLDTLKQLEFYTCHNMSISQESANNIRKLVLFSNNIKSEIKLKFPELKIFKYLSHPLLEEIIELGSMTKLKELFIDMDKNYKIIKNFDKLGIEDLSLFTFQNDTDKITKALEKTFQLKNLKKFTIELTYINNKINNILPLLGQNNSVEKIKIIWFGGDGQSLLDNFQKKFPNASFLKIQEQSKKIISSIEIKENEDLKVNKINIDSKGRNNKIYIHSYETLTDVKLSFNEYIHQKDGFALFEEKCDIIFKSLINLELSFAKIDLKLINNLFNNLKKFPNLKNFKLDCQCVDIDEKSYENYIKKLLSLKLKSIILKIKKYKKKETDISKSEDSEKSEENNKKYYSENELKNMNNNFNIMKYNKIFIYKFK